MDQHVTANISKRNAPLQCTTVGCCVCSAVVAVLYALVLQSREFRPGVIEVVAATAATLIVSRFAFRFVPRYMTDLAEMCRRTPWLKWWVLAGFPLRFRSAQIHHCVFALALLAGLLALSGMLYVFLAQPSLGKPWAHPGSGEFMASFVPAAVLYLALLFISLFTAEMRWYLSLPD